MKTVVLTVLLVVLAVVSADKCKEKCANCEAIERSDCLAGVSKDSECGCCDVCSQFEGQRCDKKEGKHSFGRCGDGLECKKSEGGYTCQCVWDEIVCGTDEVTYRNLCQLMAVAVREGKQESLKVKAVGPCEPGARILTKPSYVRNSTNNNAVLTCEAIGFPTPTITWTQTRANSKVLAMPGDDNHILTAMRGGPGKYQVTSWMQIEGLMKRHEGDYTCIASNEVSEDKATARIKVINN